MKVLVIENEQPAAAKICRMLKKIDGSIIIPDIIETVESAINWLQNNNPPDLIIMDIQLDDGLCFEIFETIDVETPVIFTTAFDEYLLRAFKVNSVDYLLKPIDEDSLSAALLKYRKIFLERRPLRIDIERILMDMAGHYKNRFLIRTGLKYRSIPVSEISHFHISEKCVFLSDKSGKDYGIDTSLDHLEKVLDPEKFFRINRDCILSIDSISQIQSYSASQLQLTVKNERHEDRFVVSRSKVKEFKRWIDR